MAHPNAVNFYRREWDRLTAVLNWLYGPERTTEILAGRDPQSNADLAKWRGLGGFRSPHDRTPNLMD